MPKGKAKAERAGKYRITGGGQPEKERKKNIKKAQRLPSTRTVNPKRSELGEFLYDNENSDRPMSELVEEFRKGCPHNFVEIAHLHKDSRRYTYQTCRRCGLFATNSKATT